MKKLADTRLRPLMCIMYLHACIEISSKVSTAKTLEQSETTTLSVLATKQIQEVKHRVIEKTYVSQEQKNDHGHRDLSRDFSEPCTLKVDPRSVILFARGIKMESAVFIYLHLKPEADIGIYGNRSVVEKTTWVWTFYENDGTLQFLRWPSEFGIWSMGLLNSYVVKYLPVRLSRVSGNCSSLQIGARHDDKVISKALLGLFLTTPDSDKKKYAASYFCYRSRLYIQPRFVYVLCQHIVCPLEALKYVCCMNFFNNSVLNRSMLCPDNRFNNFYYDSLSWIFPTIVSVLVFAYCPLFILYMAHIFVDGNHIRLANILQNLADDTDEDEIIDIEDIVFLDGLPPVTLTQTLLSPFRKCCLGVHSKASETGRSILKRAVRVLVPFLSLSVICLQICLDYFKLHTFVLESVDKGVPMGFRSVLAGYELSKDNFLPYFGGPFVAVGMYVCLTCFMIMLPSSVSGLLLTGLQGHNINETLTPLCLKLRSVERLGSMRTRHKHGFLKLYKVLISQIFMLINSKFWNHVLTIQVKRWNRVYIRREVLVFLPVYCIICFLEHILCILLYGFPVISFGLVILRAFFGRIVRKRLRTRLFSFLCSVIITVSVAFFLFMTGTIFMDASLFFTRVATFTFTGIVIYPRVSYGYMIFAFTVIYYIWQCFREFSEIYYRLLKDTITVGESLQRANATEQLVVKAGDLKGVKTSIFEHVIEVHCPRRKQAFVSVIKGTVVLTVLGLLINILIQTGGFRELHIVMHVGTALFVCALPQIIKSMCRRLDTKFRQRRFQRELRKTIKEFSGYYSQDVQTELSE